MKPNKPWNCLHLAVPWFVSFHMSPKYLGRLLIMLQALFFSTLPLLALFPPSRASTGLKSNCGPPSVIHEIDRLEQTNIHDRSEKFPPQNVMMKTATLQKVEKIRKFHCFWHHSTKWLLAPTFGGPNFFPICSSENWEAQLFRTPPRFAMASFILGAIFKSSWTMRFHYTRNKAISATFPT